jgi:hypothetical protein
MQLPSTDTKIPLKIQITWENIKNSWITADKWAMDLIGTRKIVRSGTNYDQKVRKIDRRLWYGVLCPLTQLIRYGVMRNCKKILNLSATDTVDSRPFPRLTISTQNRELWDSSSM